jgi:formate hydrogenlyase subunit 6/NADH:ubiquinone oxidoreductase subunit I
LKLEEKQRLRIGLAAIDKNLCVAHKQKTPCVVCYVSCPIDAIRLAPTGVMLEWDEPLLAPEIVEDRCTGCSLCEAACPVAGKGAIKTGPPPLPKIVFWK